MYGQASGYRLTALRRLVRGFRPIKPDRVNVDRGLAQGLIEAIALDTAAGVVRRAYVFRCAVESTGRLGTKSP